MYDFSRWGLWTDCCVHCNEPLGSIKFGKYSWPVERLLSPQKGLRFQRVFVLTQEIVLWHGSRIRVCVSGELLATWTSWHTNGEINVSDR